MFKHILFPTDTSETSNSGFAVALDVAEKYNARLTVLNIHEEFMNSTEMQYLRVSPTQYEEFMRNKAVKSREVLEEMVKAAGAEDRCEILLREGNARSEIVPAAEELGADLIVMTSTGRTNLKETLLGSVAEHVVHTATIPVLVVRTKKRG